MEQVKEGTEVATEAQVAEDLHDEAFEEAAKEEASAGSETTSEEKPADEKKPEEKPAEGKKAEATLEKKEEKKPAEEKPVESEEVKTLKQSLEDTKRWGTDNAQKVAELSRRLEALEKKPEAKDEEIPEEIKAFYEDYPEFKKAVEFEAKRLMKGITPSLTPEAIKPIQEVIGQMNFNQALTTGLEDDKGNFIEGHPDGIKIASSKEFKKWAEKDPDADTSDPIRAINLIGRFKESKVKAALKEHDKETEKEKKEREAAAGASISSTKGGGSRAGGKADKEDYDGAFEEAARN